MGLGPTQPLNRNEYQEYSWGVNGGQRVGQTTLLPSVSRLSRKCGSLNVSQPYGPSHPVTGIAFFFATTDDWDCVTLRMEQLDNKVYRKWRLDSILSGRTSLTTVPSTRVTGTP
jgi:hypothetical protein